MHAIVYLSEPTLRQLQPPRRVVPFSIREHGTPGAGPEGPLDLVIARLRRTARWYDEDVPVGEWVRFEARLGLVTTRAGRSGVLLFAEPPGHASTRRLVLRGTPEYLLDHSTEPSPIRWGGDDLVALTRILDDTLDGRTATWMGGYAQVTAAAADPPLVVASPLFVEYVPAPDQ